MNEIRGMLSTLNQKNKEQHAEKITDMIAQIDQDDSHAPISGPHFGGGADVEDLMDDADLESWVKKQKAEIKQMQAKLEASKKEYK